LLIQPHLEFKLADIPEMGYTSEDKDESGNPSPRGEIWLRGNGVIIGYYKRKDLTE
jgi:long-subunit acyl-CoA synthetase (AMP-forming)